MMRYLAGHYDVSHRRACVMFVADEGTDGRGTSAPIPSAPQATP